MRSYFLALIKFAAASFAASRRWPPENFSGLINKFKDTYAGSVLLLGASEEQGVVKGVEEGAGGGVFNLCGKLSLEGLGAALLRSRVLITNESGAMHAAWALGVPRIVLAGPSDTNITSPYGEGTDIIQHKELECVPCVRNICRKGGKRRIECMKKITVDEVFAVLTRILPR